MKKKIFALIENAGLIVKHYETYRSDMGTQVYNVAIQRKSPPTPIEYRIWTDSYFPGETDAQEKVLSDLVSFIDKFKNRFCGNQK